MGGTQRSGEDLACHGNGKRFSIARGRIRGVLSRLVIGRNRDFIEMISSEQFPKVGLTHWMQQVLTQADRAAERFESGAVHDLRTALRRCRSIADGAMVFDPNPAWKKMKKAGKQLFQSLG